MRVLITGAGSYLGEAIRAALLKSGVEADELDVRGPLPENAFQGYDRVVHVAGIAHQKETAENRPLYEQVNHHLAVEIARAAKAQGVQQFVFFSTMSVYGLTAPVGKPVTITKDTPLKPNDHYGRSKAAAEEKLLPLSEDSFRVAVLRPPMVYGKGCKGNYRALEAFAQKLPFFPLVENRRSMVYIDNLAELIRQLIDDGAAGIFCPQNEEYTNTSRMVAAIARAKGRRVVLVGGFTWALKLLSPFVPAVNKAFGSLCYDRALSAYGTGYCVKSLPESIAETEN